MNAPTNRQPTSELSRADVDAAIARLAQRDEDLARDAEHIVESLTWGEGPGVIRLSGVQEWLWYILPTKYMTDEVGFMQRLAHCAADLFDELGLHGYAAVCRSDETAAVHAAYDQDHHAGRTAMIKAAERSGIKPPDLDDFEWGPIMGINEARAFDLVEDALEEAIDAGRLTRGSNRWRNVQAQITAETLDGDHDEWPNQTWRMAIVTERLESWVRAADLRSPAIASARAAISNRLLTPIDAPTGAGAAVHPIVWLLERWGAEQPLTQAGYLKPSFVTSLQPDRPWVDEFEQPVNKEIDDLHLHHLRIWLQKVGALRKYKATLRRTKLGDAMAADSGAAWATLTANLAGAGWDGFVAETALLVMLTSQTSDTQPEPVDHDEIVEFIRVAAAEMGWVSEGRGGRESPSTRDVSWTLADAARIWTICGLIERSGTWRDRRTNLTDVGRAAALGSLRRRGAGPSSGP